MQHLVALPLFRVIFPAQVGRCDQRKQYDPALLHIFHCRIEWSTSIAFVSIQDERATHFSAASLVASAWCCDSSFGASSLSALTAASDADAPFSTSSATRLALLSLLWLLLCLVLVLAVWLFGGSCVVVAVLWNYDTNYESIMRVE